MESVFGAQYGLVPHLSTSRVVLPTEAWDAIALEIGEAVIGWPAELVTG
ncbi:MAG TPA: hypothetical protein VEB64_12220 [Azospirillaceae bacterium]|nr:hypothetical protein [Azospirillaceae bacterium]